MSTEVVSGAGKSKCPLQCQFIFLIVSSLAVESLLGARVESVLPHFILLTSLPGIQQGNLGLRPVRTALSYLACHCDLSPNASFHSRDLFWINLLILLMHSQSWADTEYCGYCVYWYSLLPDGSSSWRSWARASFL